MTNQGIQKVLDQYHAGIPTPEIVTGVMRSEQVKKWEAKDLVERIIYEDLTRKRRERKNDVKEV
ncbi:MAG: hypothetical protein KH056_07030 [Clostridiales bacterium]|nr:hypothetical protein [Clostridiales bacterium]